VIALLLVGPSLLRRWSHGAVLWNPGLALVIALNTVIQSVTGVYATALGSLSIVREPARIVVLQALLNVVTCATLIRAFGVRGAAAGSLITFTLTSALYVPWKARKALACA